VVRERKRFRTEEAYEAFLREHPERVLDPTQQGLVIDRNLYFPDEEGRLVLYGVEWRPKHRVFSTLAPFVEWTGFDRHSRVANPLFVQQEAGDYRFRPESPAWAMQVGWLQVPGDVEAWMRDFLPKEGLTAESERMGEQGKRGDSPPTPQQGSPR
jgi:hypothetical protein